MKTIIIALVAVVLIASGVSAYLVLGSDDKESASTDTTTNVASDQPATENNPTDEETQASQLATADSILEDGKDVECTFSYEDGADTGEGTGYFTGGTRMRMDFKSTTAGEEYDGGMIISATKQIVWDNEKKVGFAMNLSDDSSSSADEAAQGFDTSKEVDYDCKAWEVDETKFTAPAGIQITDLSTLNVPGMP